MNDQSSTTLIIKFDQITLMSNTYFPPPQKKKKRNDENILLPVK